MTHADLVEIGRNWLVRVQHCSVVTTEIKHSVVAESPDCLGWDGQSSFLIEAKTSRSDFLADRKKIFRQTPKMGMGIFRYYLTPPGLVDASEIPPNWGLLESSSTRRRPVVIRKALPQAADTASEVKILLSLLRRGAITSPGVNIRVFQISGYQQEKQAKTTMAIEPENMDVKS